MIESDRFWLKVNRNGPVFRDLGSCWLWTAYKDRDGYGQFGSGQRAAGTFRLVKAHRYAHELLVGPIPEGLEPDHLCRNPSCVNPAHLELVTHRENTLRGQGPTAKHAQKTQCKRGHPLTDDNLVERRLPYRICKVCATATAKERMARWIARTGRTAGGRL